jgi:pimeloyl-ACP methyl ester carboxylesterase
MRVPRVAVGAVMIVVRHLGCTGRGVDSNRELRPQQRHRTTAAVYRFSFPAAGGISDESHVRDRNLGRWHPIALEQTGGGPPVVLVGGAFNDRSTVAGLAAVLAPGFTAVTYDRRGRGDSGDSGDYAVEREIEDLAVVISRAGGSASVFGHSSGAVLGLEAAQRGVGISKLAAYEPTYVVDGARPRPADDLAGRLRALIAEDRRDEDAALFLAEAIGMPAEVVEGMRASDMWGWFTGLAHTLPYDAAVCGPGMVLPAGRLAAINIPVLAIGGGTSPEWLPAAARAVAAAIPGSRYVTLDGQDHGVLNQPGALGPLLTGFLT